MPFGLAPPWKYPTDVPVYLKGQLQVDIIARYRISLPQNEGWTASLPFRQPLDALKSGLGRGRGKGSWVFGVWTLKANSYHTFCIVKSPPPLAKTPLAEKAL